ncbi:AMP-binding protein [Solimonas marina]|uniref:Long-chain fatty acid--CoA ligase n=1 Tax=Solimonas marina TaxID=2714601 RepID=A0A970B6P5_9GAMM|nr:AMP-binding protein [Solimonas marina]NKF22820.1 long-chain fatty acid--CoA ligase [Solimonas marina]
MNTLFEALQQHARERPQQIALTDGKRELSYAELLDEVEKLAAQLRFLYVDTLALYADNGIGWVISDLAAMSAGIRCVPLPRFFSDAQLLHALRDSDADALLADDERMLELCDWDSEPQAICGCSWKLVRRSGNASRRLPPHTQKITYTSGTTGDPKGVCLSADSQIAVARSLMQASGAQAQDRHLCVLPLSTLLENIGGVYAPLLVGATIVALPQAEVGMGGAAQLDVPRLLGALHATRATTAILVPQLLMALVTAGEMGAPRPPSLRFIAVGGAPVSRQLLERAQRLGLPVYEGYGLSESSSVVALNTAQAQRVGSVGKPLPHLQLRFADDGEVWVRGSGFLGYCGQTAPDANDGWIATGDLGHLDADGYLHLDGRKKSQFITAFGRNVAPEWVERELTQHAVIAHAAVFGEARPWNVAIIVARPLPGVDVQAAITAAVAAANRELPDYARIRRWLFADEPFTAASGLITANGRIRRAEVLARYGERLDHLYMETST